MNSFYLTLMNRIQVCSISYQYFITKGDTYCKLTCTVVIIVYSQYVYTYTSIYKNGDFPGGSWIHTKTAGLNQSILSPPGGNSLSTHHQDLSRQIHSPWIFDKCHFVLVYDHCFSDDDLVWLFTPCLCLPHLPSLMSSHWLSPVAVLVDVVMTVVLVQRAET